MTQKRNDKILPSSFRDPSGFLFYKNGNLYRQVNRSYQQAYQALIESGLYDKLTKKELLVSHEETDVVEKLTEEAFCVIKPQPLSFISYPYEWSFSQLKDAALTTLQIQKIAFEHKMALKDASAYNIQFHNGRPIFIDTLSFETYTEGQAWTAYRQFCQHFLAPLALMSKTDIRLQQLLRSHIDGIPLDLASRLLPPKTWLKPSLLMHIHLHAKSQQRYSDKPVKSHKKNISQLSFRGLIDSFESAVKRLTWRPAGTEWGDYYSQTNYSDQAMESKKKIVEELLGRIQPRITWDLGANTGQFSQIAASLGSNVIAFDIDPAAVEKGYRGLKKTNCENILPLILDLSNPSPALGWAHSERMSLIQRANADTVLALALIHHLAISNNLPLAKIADFFSQISPWLVIEFVPKDDSQVQRLLSTREDIFPNYTQDDFEKAFSQYYRIKKTAPVPNSQRTLYLMERQKDDA
jgi:ribosomal protein L11 methylase PrmA